MALNGGTGAVAQALTLGASIAPVLWGRTEALILVVTASGLVTTVIPALSLAVSHRVPAMRTREDVLTAVSHAAIVSLAGSATIIAGFATTAATTSTYYLAYVGCAVGALSAGRALFTVTMASLTWMANYQLAMLLRLAYGAGALALTLAATVADADPVVYVLALAAAHLAAVALLTTLRSNLFRHITQSVRATSPRQVVGSVWASRTLIVSLTVGAFATSIAALATPLLGPYSEAWAVVVRIATGIQTVGAQVLGVALDIRVVRAMREDGRVTLTKEVRRSVVIGGALGIVGALLSVAAVIYTIDDYSTKLLLAGAIYSVAASAISPIGRMLGILGRARDRLIWDTTRFVAATALLLWIREEWLLWGLVALTSASYISFAWLVLTSSHHAAKH